jgi:hypothetical protein
MFETPETSTKKASLKKGAVTVPATTRAAKPAPAHESIASDAVSPAERNRMVAEAAYYIAERRGFAECSPLEDWLAAESQIDAMLSRRTA